MNHAVLQVLCAALGTLGFSVFFRVRASHLPIATLGGALSWAVCLLVQAAGGSVFFSTPVMPYPPMSPPTRQPMGIVMSPQMSP